MPIKRIGAEEGLRANALIVPCPITATTSDGPIMAARITKTSVTKDKCQALTALIVQNRFFNQNDALIFIKFDDAFFDREQERQRLKENLQEKLQEKLDETYGSSN